MDGPRTQSGILGLCEGWIRLSEEELRRCTNCDTADIGDDAG
jgi:hypothetical protein